MRKAAVRNGDRTTTGGTVFARAATLDDNGKKLALDGESATCGQCEGVFRIVSSCTCMSDNGRQVVLNSDAVLCPCGRNEVVAGGDARVFVEVRERAARRRGEVLPGHDAGVPDTSAAASAPASHLRSIGRPDLPDLAPTRGANTPDECAYLDGTRSRIDAPSHFYATLHDVELSEGMAATIKVPRIGTIPVTAYDASIAGRHIDVYISEQRPPEGTSVFSIEQIAHALGTLPAAHLENLTKIMVSPRGNPDDAYWQANYGIPDFYSAASASIEEGVTTYPWKAWPNIPQRYVDSTMTHETGHQIGQALWSDPAKKVEWERAVASDPQAPSEYAKHNLFEDFAESANLYRSSKGSPCEAEGRKRYPARYRYFDAFMK
ncbi:PAAR domain-containing protein [Burkholderia sp. Ac-20379]|uniref:PAAR domain-containing protein n=1 Tax=Burkholderia sp. Ac-20379 TaxID=2703900 RepID=UPI00197FA2E6|nr:PAAR domain-containing protein [Burkholderia sp. Ac-20379]MBN3728669.1 PAAR domain-containing protein [Burkholderia sp. Ac-20379]